MVLTVSFVLPGDRLVVTVACRLGFCLPGRARKTSANLTPAPGRQDHTTSPSAATSLVCTLLIAHGRTRPAITLRAQSCRVHRIPPRVHDDRDTPLCGWGQRFL